MLTMPADTPIGRYADPLLTYTDRHVYQIAYIVHLASKRLRQWQTVSVQWQTVHGSVRTVPGGVQTVPGGSGQRPYSSGRLLVGLGMTTVAGVASCTNKNIYIYIFHLMYI